MPIGYSLLFAVMAIIANAGQDPSRCDAFDVATCILAFMALVCLIDNQLRREV